MTNRNRGVNKSMGKSTTPKIESYDMNLEDLFTDKPNGMHAGLWKC